MCPRPRRFRRISFNPSVYYFKPSGIPMSELQETYLERDELEALKLHDVQSLDQVSAAKQMGISQPTFARILDSAYKKIADAIVNGKAIVISKT